MSRLSVLVLLSGFLAGSAWAQGAGNLPPSSDPGKECASYGLAPNTDGYNACVSALAGPNALTQLPDVMRQRDALKAQIDQQNADLQKRIQQQLNAGQNLPNGDPSKCVRTVNGTNVSISCP